jgi:hypothetical protein
MLLCALTLISCTLGIIESVSTLHDPAKATQRLKNPDNDPSVVMPANPQADVPTGPIEIISISDLVFNVLCLIGAALMFFGRRIGWFVYVGGIVMKIAVPLVLAGSWIGIVSPGPFFSAIFAALYAYNWSYFR